MCALRAFVRVSALASPRTPSLPREIRLSQGYWAVYRISCTLAIFFLLMMILTACTCKGSVHAHQGYWFAKAVFLVGVLAAILFAPNDMLAVYAWIARFIAPLFLVYQVRCPCMVVPLHGAPAWRCPCMAMPLHGDAPAW